MGITRRSRPAEPTITLTSSGGVLTLDLTSSRYFQVTLTENITSVVITGLQGAGYAASFMLWISQHASSAKTFSMPAAFDWDGGTVGTISTAVGVTDLLAGSTRNGGSSWDVTLSKGRA